MTNTSKENRHYGRRGSLLTANEKCASPITGKQKKNDLLNRNEICDLMLWSQSELTWHIKHAGLPVFGNKFSRSAIRDWEYLNSPIRTAS